MNNFCAPLYEYQLKDFFFKEQTDSEDYRTPGPFDFMDYEKIFRDSLAGIGGSVSSETSEFVAYIDSVSNITLVFANHIYPRCKDKTVLVRNTELTTEEKQEFFYKICVWLSTTEDKHTRALEAFEQDGDLMRPLTSTNKSYFNDTPQSPNPDLDTHVTTYNKNESLNDLTTPIARIEEIRRLYENEFENWCNDFINTFIIM